MAELYGQDLARVHDAGFGHLARAAAADALDLLTQSGLGRGLVVDLGCGTGILAERLSDAGHPVIGVDVSEAALAIARRRAPEAKFAHASFDEFELPRCAAVLAVGEVLNYRSGERDSLGALLGRVRAALEPSGFLLCDVAEPGREPVPRRSWSQGEGWLVCVDAAEDAGMTLTRAITVFTERDGAWRRDDERHSLRLHPRDELAAQLRATGFEVELRPSYAGLEPIAGLPVFLARPGGAAGA